MKHLQTVLRLLHGHRRLWALAALGRSALKQSELRKADVRYFVVFVSLNNIFLCIRDRVAIITTDAPQASLVLCSAKPVTVVINAQYLGFEGCSQIFVLLQRNLMEYV